jgi:hypothetical protein
MVRRHNSECFIGFGKDKLRTAVVDSLQEEECALSEDGTSESDSESEFGEQESDEKLSYCSQPCSLVPSKRHYDNDIDEIILIE